MTRGRGRPGIAMGTSMRSRGTVRIAEIARPDDSLVEPYRAARSTRIHPNPVRINSRILRARQGERRSLACCRKIRQIRCQDFSKQRKIPFPCHACGTEQVLARMSHELSATAPDPSASAAFYGAFLAPDQARSGSSTYRHSAPWCGSKEYASGALRARALL